MVSKKIIGIDFGSSNIRIVEAELDKNGKLETIEAVYTQPIPSQVITNGNVVSQQALTASLQEILSKNNIKTKEAYISINGDSVISRNLGGIESEKDERDFQKILQFKIKERVPVEWGEIEYSYHVLNEYVDETQNKILRDIMFVSIAKSNLKPILRSVQEVGLKPYVVDIGTLGILRAAAAAEDITDKRISSIDIGADTITIVIHKNGYPEYARTITNVGGSIINQRISSELNIELITAEKEKFKALTQENTIAQKSTSVFGGFDIDGIDPSSREAAKAQSINLIVAQEVSVIVSQIRDTFNDALFNSPTIDSPIEKIILSGGGSSLQTLAARIQNELNNIPVEYINPLEKFASKSLKKQLKDQTILPHEFANVAGLVIRDLGEK